MKMKICPRLLISDFSDFTLRIFRGYDFSIFLILLFLDRYFGVFDSNLRASPPPPRMFSYGVLLGLFLYIYFLLFEENIENQISRAGEKNFSNDFAFFRKMIA